MYDNDISPEDLHYTGREWEAFQKLAETDPQRALRDLDRRTGIRGDEAATSGQISGTVGTSSGSHRQRSPAEVERIRRGQDRPSRATERNARIRESHDMGVEGGRARALRENITIEDWNTPQQWIPEFGRGIDDIGTRGSKLLVIEHKGGSSRLASGRAVQMSNEWVGQKIAQLEILGDPMSARLLQKARSGDLQGVVYRTRQLQGGESRTRRLSQRALRNRMRANVSPSGLIQYAPRRVERAYLAELRRLREAVERGDLRALRNL